VVNNTQPLAIVVRARVLQHESDGSAFQGGGLQFGFTQGNTLWAMGVSPTQIRNINGTILSSAYDNTGRRDRDRGDHLGAHQALYR
jgi:hypothetical protein